MNYLIIGHSVVDKINEKGKIKIKPGGIFYTVMTFLTQMKPYDKLFLCSAVDNKNEDLFNEIYERVEEEHLAVVDSIPEVELIINPNDERNEIYTNLGNNLSVPFENLNQFAGILINMITGFDISLSQIQEIRKKYDGLIYFDVHTLSRGIDDQMNRNFRRIQEFDKWAQCVDILQANESELFTISEHNNEIKIIKEIFRCGIKQIIITRAEKGASIYFSEGSELTKYDVEALQLKANNKIGCGDVFGAVYFYNYIQNKNILSALEKANLYAGVSTTYSDINEFKNFSKDAAKQSCKK